MKKCAELKSGLPSHVALDIARNFGQMARTLRNRKMEQWFIEVGGRDIEGEER